MPGQLHRVPAQCYVEIDTPDGVLAARGDGGGWIGPGAVLGWRRHLRFARDFGRWKEHSVDVMVAPYEGGWPPAADELRWPHPPEDAQPARFWEEVRGADLEAMVRDEAAQVAAVVEALTPRLPRGARVLDVACSHGECLAALARHRPDLRLEGLDRAAAMVERTRQRVPTARVEVGDALDLGSRRADAVVSRAFSHEVMTRPEALAGVAESARVTEPGGWVVLCSWRPPLCQQQDVRPLGSVEQTIRVASDGALRPVYVVRITGSAPGDGA